jgi:putative glutamine amidotransferase
VTAPLIAIPTYHLGPGRVGNWEGAYALPEPYVAGLRAAGARVAMLPPAQPGDPEEVLAPFDGLLLAGGGDVEPARYGAADHPAQYGVDPERDQLELELVGAAVRLGLPVLGICRGVQLLNVAFGGTLVQHLPDQDAEHPAEHQVEHRNDAMQAMHGLRVEPGSRLAEAIGQVEAEGSPPPSGPRPHRGTGSGRLGAGRAGRGDPSARGAGRSALWHPESTAAADPVQRRPLRAFVDAASRRGQAFWRRSAEPEGLAVPGAPQE